MFDAIDLSEAIDAPNQFVEVDGRTLAYRSIGTGKPLILCTRFRGNLDTWDPAFLRALADKGLRVITFDYTGLGLSTGTPSYHPVEMAQDPIDLAEALQLENAAIGGWSLGGLAAQAAITIAPDLFTHAILIGTNPPGLLVKPAEQLFFDLAGIENNSLEDEIALFFEPASEASRKAARTSHDRIAQRTKDRSPDIPIGFARQRLGDGPRNPAFPSDAVLDALKTTSIPILHIGGDHDIVFPVENWYALTRQLETLHVFTFPAAGHGPQHQFPEISGDLVASFIRNTSR